MIFSRRNFFSHFPKKQIFSVLFLFSLIFSGFCNFNRLGIPDSTDIRKKIEATWLYDNIDSLRQKNSEIFLNAIGQEFQVRLEETDNTFAIIVAPMMRQEVDFYSDKGVERKTVCVYPSDAQGSWILVRSTETGKPLFVRMYFASDSDVFVEFSAEKNKTLADFVICNEYAAKSVPVGFNFDRLFTASFEYILQITEKALPWKYAKPNASDYNVSLSMASKIRKNLSRIEKTPDAAYDENFKPVKISDGTPREIPDNEKSSGKLSLSEAGFLKWIIDGLMEPTTGSGAVMNPLTQMTVKYKTQGQNGALDASNDYSYSFSLDWCRNLCAAWLSAQKSRSYSAEHSGLDVKINPFSAKMTENGLKQNTGYIKDSGYKISELRSLLYVLAHSEKSYFYLGAIRRLDLLSKDSPHPFYVFDKCAAFFPYFTEDGRFDCIVFQDGEEIPFKVFVENNKENFLHLTRCLSSKEFYLQ